MKAYWHVQCPEHSEFIQKKLFDMGYRWNSGDTEIRSTSDSRLSLGRFNADRITSSSFWGVDDNKFQGSADMTNHPDWCWPRPKEEEKPKLQRIMKNAKWEIACPEHSKFIQEKLFEMGYKWDGYGKKLEELDAEYLFADSECAELGYENNKEYFCQSPYTNMTNHPDWCWPRPEIIKVGDVVKYKKGEVEYVVKEVYVNQVVICKVGYSHPVYTANTAQLKIVKPKQKELVFELGRKYKTRDGIKVILDFVDEVPPTKYPYRFSGGDGDSFWCYANGLSCVGNGLKDKLDIIDYWEEENKNNLTKEENNGIIPAKEITEERKETKENDNTTTTKGNGNETNTKYSFRY